MRELPRARGENLPAPQPLTAKTPMGGTMDTILAVCICRFLERGDSQMIVMSTRKIADAPPMFAVRGSRLTRRRVNRGLR